MTNLQKGKTLEISYPDNNTGGGVLQIDENKNLIVRDIIINSFKESVLNFSALPDPTTYISGGGADGDLYSVLEDQGSSLLLNKKESGAYKFIEATLKWEFISSVIQGVAQKGGDGVSKIITERKSANYTVVGEDEGKLLVVDTSAGDVTITMPVITTETEGFKIYIKNIGDNDVIIQTPNLNTVKSLSSFSIGANSYYGFSSETGNWEDFIKEIPAVQGDVTHFIGFYIEDGKLYADIAPVSADEVINLAKYNVLFEDGTPAWKFSSMSIVLELADQAGITVNF